MERGFSRIWRIFADFFEVLLKANGTRTDGEICMFYVGDGQAGSKYVGDGQAGSKYVGDGFIRPEITSLCVNGRYPPPN
ncbi:MAG: hypothetical protein FWG87_00735 [Defluviitaleaceae bacterium]|nr:hypothetical protein [Defluviitaleaceae bacterium]